MNVLSVFCVISKLKKSVFFISFILSLLETVTSIPLHCNNTVKDSEKKNTQPWENMRLIDDIVPYSYFLAVDVNMENDLFDGKVSIFVNVTKSTNVILLHQVDLQINYVLLKNLEDNQIQIESHYNYFANEYYVIKVSSMLIANMSYVIFIDYNGTLRSDLNGFYKSSYKENNITHNIASTFFSPISARKAFPCFDEPKFKAKFSLALTHNKKYHAISNMPKLNSKHNGKKISTLFQTTPIMSTYTVCWVVSDYKNIKLITNNGLVIKAWAPYKQLAETEYTLNATAMLLKYFEDYFKIPFLLKKLDIVAIPNFGAGAMENWGLITYRSDKMLINNEISTEIDKQATFLIIAHELVHQWFGNLATMKFWTDAWLKEGFASYISYYGSDQLKPNMEPMKKIFTELMIPAFKLDSFLTSHPISTNITNSNEIREIFDTITYNKGSCIVQMLQSYLGKEKFRKGLQQYLNIYAYKNADQDDLWKQLSLVSGKDIKSVMDTWTLQLGFPVVSIDRIDNETVIVSQERFSLDILKKDKHNQLDYLWKVPLIYRIKGNTFTYLLSTKQATIKFPTDGVMNPDHIMYYKINYDTITLNVIKNTLELNYSKLTVQDRTGIISDLFSMATVGKIKINKVLDTIKYIKNENDYYPWQVTLSELSFIDHVKNEDNFKEKFQVYIKSLISKVVIDLGWRNPNSTNKGLLQSLVLGMACKYNTEKIIEDSKEFFRNWMKGEDIKVRYDLHSIIRSCAISHGTPEFWEYAFQNYLNSGTQKYSILMSLTETKNKTILQRFLNYTLDPNIISSEDTPYILGNIASNSRVGRELTWDFIKKNINILLKRYGNELFLLPKLFSSVINSFTYNEDLRDIELFFANKMDLKSGKQAVKQSIENIKSKLEWKKKNEEDLNCWVSDNVY
ncbi:aminopeptidase A-like isoform X2 [Hydra vulgaris]|uniref:Aminopeptidase n=1 Tax=Hydra vulgaris TaxID=6087 RepID=A0ABM4DG55_HYDVU